MTTPLHLLVPVSASLTLMAAACTPPPTPPPSAAFHHQPETRRDSVLEAANHLGRVVHLLDRYARPTGNLPETLEPVLASFPHLPARDLWGNRIRYSPAGLRYELRAAGPDGEFNTADDIVSLGQLGRVFPCETRHLFGAIRYEDSSPPCSSGRVHVVPPCPELLWVIEDSVAGAAARDTTLMTGSRMVRFARYVDGHGRNLGALPLSLRQVVSNQDLTDGWGRVLRYERRETSFELRSAGVDGTFDSGDDIVVGGVLGHTIPCAFWVGAERFACSAAPPPCPEGEIRA